MFAFSPKTLVLSLTAAAALSLSLAACGQQKDPAGQVIADTNPTSGAPASGTASGAAFDVSSVALSSAPLGAYPYIRLPQGYREMNPQTQDFADFPFWTGARFQMVEGKVHQAQLDVVSGKSFSRLELLRNIQTALTAAGGVKIFDGQIPSADAHALPEAVQLAALTGMGDIYNSPSETWVIRQADRVVWINLFVGNESGAWSIVEQKSLVTTAGLLPAEQLAQKINADGRVAIPVNFDIDKTDILTSSTPQIDAVAELLRAQPGLRLSVEGHTDNSGAPAHNKTLSEGRARSVVAALTAKGVAADRLQARGLGNEKPVADNANDDGRARNRRVELVRL